MNAPAFAELAAASNFSFLQGASSAQEMVLAALLLDYTGVGLADRNTVAGVVRAFAALRDLKEGGVLPPVKRRIGGAPGEYYYEPAIPGQDPKEAEALHALVGERAKTFKLATGARLVFTDGTPDIVAHPQNREGWGRLCRLLTRGNRISKKGECRLTRADLLADARDLSLIVMPTRHRATLAPLLRDLDDAAPGSLWLAACMPRRGDDRRRLMELQDMAQLARVPLIASNDALYADPSARDLQDVLACIRHGRTIETAGRLLAPNAERHLKHPAEMLRLFADCPEAIAETQRCLETIGFSLDQLSYEYPDEPVPPGRQPQEWLTELTWRAASLRYRQAIPPKVEAQIEAELALIAKLGYARYFLTIHDIVRVAEDKKILCQGRGSAANSAVCYVLGITCVDPAEHDLLFARFMSEERREPPDIDVDFEHERREEVIQHIYERYGRERAGIAATVISYRPKSAIRDVGKALGLSEDVTAALSGTQWGSWGSEITRTQVAQAGLDPGNPSIARAVAFAQRLLGYPRHLSQHVGGFILTRGRLDELVPIGNAAMADRTFIEWDKDDIDTLKLMKVDILALGMLTCIRKAFDDLRVYEGERFTLFNVPAADEATYDMLCKGDSIGVFQVESRAQINMLPRLRPRCLYDLVVEVALVRPGPIQGNMVHPYLRNRNAKVKPPLPSPAPPHDPHELHDILKNTHGVPIFQEQAMKIAMVAAEFTDVEANQLRRAMATFKHVGTIHLFEDKMVERMVRRGYDRAFAKDCFEQIKGFGSYGFPESHAASFAKLVYISSWIKRHHPAIFTCALLNSQPMGFYAPAQLVRDAREHGVEVRAADINHSLWDNTLERRECGGLALRLGFRQLDGFQEAEALRLVAARVRPFDSMEGLSVKAKLRGRPLRILADADCFRSLDLDRRKSLWAVRRLPDDSPLPLFAAAEARELAEEPDAVLPEMTLGEHVAADYQTLRLSLKAHPMEILRPIFAAERLSTCAEISAARDGREARVAGIVLVRQRPGKGTAIFITLEDETGVTNVVLWARQFEAFRREVMGARLMEVRGLIQKSPEGVVHLMAASIFDRTGELRQLTEVGKPAETIPPPLHLAPPPRHRHPRDARVLPKSRDFH